MFGLTFFSIVSYSHANEVIRLTTLEWSPYAGSHLINKGFSSEIIQKALQTQGIESHIDFKPWNQTLQLVWDGKYDALFSAYYTEDRAKKYFFSDPYAESILLFYTLKGKQIFYNSLEDLKGYKIGITKGFANTPEFDDAPFLTKVEADTEKASLENLIQGTVDLVVMDKYICMHLINTAFPSRKNQITALETPLDKKSLHLLFSKNKISSPQFLQAFNKGLNTIRQNGLYDLILQRHRFLPVKVIELATLEWPPYTGSKIINNGFISDLVTRIYKISGYDVQIHIRPWARALRETEFGVHDVAFPSYYSDQRNQNFILVPLNIHSNIGFMKINQAIPNTYNTLQDLKNYRIGIVHGYVNRPDFDDAGFLTKLKFYSDLETLQRLIKGDPDIIVIDKRVAGYLCRQIAPDQKFTFLSPLLDSKMLYLAFSKKVPDLDKKIMAFEYGYEEIKKTGQFKNLMKASFSN